MSSNSVVVVTCVALICFSAISVKAQESTSVGSATTAADPNTSEAVTTASLSANVTIGSETSNTATPEPSSDSKVTNDPNTSEAVTPASMSADVIIGSETSNTATPEPSIDSKSGNNLATSPKTTDPDSSHLIKALSKVLSIVNENPVIANALFDNIPLLNNKPSGGQTGTTTPSRQGSFLERIPFLGGIFAKLFGSGDDGSTTAEDSLAPDDSGVSKRFESTLWQGLGLSGVNSDYINVQQR